MCGLLVLGWVLAPCCRARCPLLGVFCCRVLLCSLLVFSCCSLPFCGAPGCWCLCGLLPWCVVCCDAWVACCLVGCCGGLLCSVCPWTRCSVVLLCYLWFACCCSVCRVSGRLPFRGASRAVLCRCACIVALCAVLLASLALAGVVCCYLLCLGVCCWAWLSFDASWWLLGMLRVSCFGGAIAVWPRGSPPCGLAWCVLVLRSPVLCSVVLCCRVVVYCPALLFLCVVACSRCFLPALRFLLCLSWSVVLCIQCPPRSVRCCAALSWCPCVALFVWSALFLAPDAVVRCWLLCCFLWCAVVRRWVLLPAVVFWWRVSVSVSLSGRVACFPVVGRRAVATCSPVLCPVVLCCCVVLCLRVLVSFCGAVCCCVSLGVLCCGGAALLRGVVSRGVLPCHAVFCGALLPCGAVLLGCAVCSPLLRVFLCPLKTIFRVLKIRRKLHSTQRTRAGRQQDHFASMSGRWSSFMASSLSSFFLSLFFT